jgi:hypothetical protein
MDWSKKEKDIARKAFKVAYDRECKAILEKVRKMVFEVNDPTGLWAQSRNLVK